MKTIEIWAPVLAAPAVSIETALPEKAKLEQAVGAETIEINLEELAIPRAGKARPLKNLFTMRPYDVNMTVLSDNLKEVLTNFQQLVNDVPNQHLVTSLMK